MFAPTACPQCRKRDSWHEVRNIFLDGIEIFDGLYLGGIKRGTRTIRYRCDSCGYKAEYDDHPETLGR